jgi:ketopantoate reductase
MKILILGAGAIGSVFGGFLAKSGHEVVLLGRQAHMATINQNGLKIEGIWGEHDITSHIKGYTSLSAIREGEGNAFDLILLTVKSYDTEAVIRDYLQYFLNNAPMVSLQNVLNRKETREIIIYIIHEIFSVIEKSKTRLFWNTPDEYLKLLFDELIPATYNHFPSMLQDIRRKRMTEIESINGSVVKTGEDLGLFLPVNKVTLNLVKVKERIARSDAR